MAGVDDFELSTARTTIRPWRTGDADVLLDIHRRPDHVGHGWATEAARAMLSHGFASGHQRVWACMWPNNASSAAVCRRLGMTDLGVLVDPWYGTTRDPHSRFFCAFADGVDVGSADEVLVQRRADRTLPDPDPGAAPAPDMP